MRFTHKIIRIMAGIAFLCGQMSPVFAQIEDKHSRVTKGYSSEYEDFKNDREALKRQISTISSNRDDVMAKINRRLKLFEGVQEVPAAQPDVKPFVPTVTIQPINEPPVNKKIVEQQKQAELVQEKAPVQVAIVSPQKEESLAPTEIKPDIPPAVAEGSPEPKQIVKQAQQPTSVPEKAPVIKAAVNNNSTEAIEDKRQDIELSKSDTKPYDPAAGRQDPKPPVNKKIVEQQHEARPKQEKASFKVTVDGDSPVVLEVQEQEVSVKFTDFPVEAEPRIIDLTLEKATQLALLNNFNIQLTKYDIWISRTQKQVAQSIYDTIFGAEAKYNKDKSSQTSTIAGSKTIENDYNVGLQKKLPSGTKVSVGLRNKKTETDASVATESITYDSTLAISLEQDLGKNIFGIQDRGKVKVTTIDIENVQYTSLEKIEESISKVQKAYWDLVLRMENVETAEAMVAEAKKLYDLQQEQYMNGLVEMADAIASEANYKARKKALIHAQNGVRSSENILKFLLNIDEDVSIRPVENFDLGNRQEELVMALKNAFTNRQDYKKAHNEIKKKNLQLAMKKNSLWPEINLKLSFSRNGIGDQYTDAVQKITEEDNPHYYAGVEIKFPIENREARGKLKESKLKKAKALLQLKLLERMIAVEVEEHVRNCNVYKEMAQYSSEIAQLQEQKLDEENRLFRYGRSNTNTLIRFQEDYVQAKGVLAQAGYRYYTALIDLYQKEGTLLSKYWIGAI